MSEPNKKAAQETDIDWVEKDGYATRLNGVEKELSPGTQLIVRMRILLSQPSSTNTHTHGR